LILIAEPTHFGATHVQVNSAFIALFSELYTSEELLVWAEDGHIQELKTKKGVFSTIAFTSFKKYSSEGYFYWLQKIVGEWMQIFKVISKAKKSNTELLVWLSLFPTGQLLVNLLSRIMLKNTKQLIVLHGEMEYLHGQRAKRSEQFLGFVLKYSLSRATKNTKYLVLGQVLKNNLSFLPQKVLVKIRAIQHPFLYKFSENSNRKPLRILSFGALKKAKNGHLFFELAKRFESEILEGKIIFNTIGKMNSDILPYRNKFVNSYKPNEFIGQEEIEDKIVEHDLAIFFYKKEMYQFTASGALHEAINAGLPFVSFPNDYFSAINARYEMGHFVASVDEMEAYLRQLLNSDGEELEKFRKSIIMFLRQNSFLLQLQNLKQILE
jgi:hypothetical protein